MVRNRNMAINALRAWERSGWPSDAAALIAVAVDEEPDDAVRDRLARLLQGEPDPET